MIRIPLFIFPVFVITISVFSCNKDTISLKNYSESSMQDLSNIKNELESGKPIERPTSFDLREFVPFLGNKWIGESIAYGYHRKGQSPGGESPNESEIFEDLSIISKHWNLIRVYGADKNVELILEVIHRNKFPIRVILGMWLEDEETNQAKERENIEQVLCGIDLANKYPETVIAISVGNETQVYWSGHKMKPESLIRYIRITRKYTKVPVTTADDFNFWNKTESEAVAKETDFILTHIHPQWNGISLENSIEWLNDVSLKLKEAHPEREIVIGETGWATRYDSGKNGPGEQGSLVKGEVSLDAQGKFLNMLHAWVTANKIVTFVFEAFDESWKGGGENSPPEEIEKKLGIVL